MLKKKALDVCNSDHHNDGGKNNKRKGWEEKELEKYKEGSKRWKLEVEDSDYVPRKEKRRNEGSKEEKWTIKNIEFEKDKKGQGSWEMICESGGNE